MWQLGKYGERLCEYKTPHRPGAKELEKFDAQASIGKQERNRRIPRKTQGVVKGGRVVCGKTGVEKRPNVVNPTQANLE